MSVFNVSSSATSNDPAATHQRLIICNGDAEHTKMMKIKTP